MDDTNNLEYLNRKIAKDLRLRHRTHVRPKRVRYLLMASFLLVAAILTCRFYLLPSLISTMETLLADNGVQLMANQPPPTLTWSISPPSIGIADIHFMLNNHSEEFPYPVELHLESVRYRIEPFDFRRLRYPSSVSQAPITINFGTVTWSKYMVSFQDPHPRPSIELSDGSIHLYSPSLRHSMAQLSHHLIGWPIATPENPTPFVEVSISKVEITTRSTTSIPISIAHPTISRLINRFPTFFNLFTASPISTSEDDTLTNAIVNPPHLSLIAPSLILPAVYQGISSFRQASPPNDNTVKAEAETYNIPTPFSQIYIQLKLERSGVRGMKNMTIAMMDEGNSLQGCSSLPIGTIDAIELSGRDANGKGGCCTLRVHNLANKPPHSTRQRIVEVITSQGTQITRVKELSKEILGNVFGLIMHPIYILIYVLSLKDIVPKDGKLDICSLKSVARYHIAHMEWIDKTPKTASTVARALGELHNGFLNVFEGAVSYIV